MYLTVRTQQDGRPLSEFESSHNINLNIENPHQGLNGAIIVSDSIPFMRQNLPFTLNLRMPLENAQRLADGTALRPEVGGQVIRTNTETGAIHLMDVIVRRPTHIVPG